MSIPLFKTRTQLYRHLYPHTHTYTHTDKSHTHRSGPDSSALHTASPDLPFVTVPFKKHVFNGIDFQKNIEPIMENVLQQLRSPSSKERKQKRGQTTSVTLPLSAPKHSLPSSGHIFKAQRIKISSKAADSGCVCVFVSITVCVNIFVLQRTNSLHFISDRSGPSVTTAAI